MAAFHKLTVTQIDKTTRDAVVLSLRPLSGDFTYLPGQYLTFRVTLEGTELRRSYSICSGLEENSLQVAIKQVDGGAFSAFANAVLKVGDTIEAMEPMGHFHTAITPDARHHYLGFAGGSGITPILSILRSVLAGEPDSRFTLVYANRAVNTIMFREELEDLKNLYMGRLSLIHVLEHDSQDIDLFTGRVTEEKCADLFAHWINLPAIDKAFICGPEPMMLGIKAALEAHGLSKEQIKFELFASAQTGRLKRKPQSASSAARARTGRITLDGASRTVTFSPDQTVLEAALENAMDAPHACRAGVCSTCKCKVLKGEVDMVTNHALEDYEVRAGYVLSCQSYPVSDEVEVDFDV